MGVDEAAQTSVRQIERAGRAEWPEIVAATEELRGRSWAEMMTAWGDWERDGVIYVAVRYGRLRLAEVVRAMSGPKYGAAAQGVRRFAAGLAQDPAKVAFVEAMKRKLHGRKRVK